MTHLSFCMYVYMLMWTYIDFLLLFPLTTIMVCFLHYYALNVQLSSWPIVFSFCILVVTAYTLPVNEVGDVFFLSISLSFFLSVYLCEYRQMCRITLWFELELSFIFFVTQCNVSIMMITITMNVWLNKFSSFFSCYLFILIDTDTNNCSILLIYIFNLSPISSISLLSVYFVVNCFTRDILIT